MRSERVRLTSVIRQIIIAIISFGLIIAPDAAYAQSLGDMFKNTIGQVLQNGNLQQAATGWLTDQLTRTLTKSSGAMPGDQRLANDGQGLALTPAEQDKANRAYTLFNQTAASAPDHPAPVPVYQAGTVEGQALQSHLRSVVQKYRGLKSLTPAQQAELHQALQPFVLAYLVRKGQQAGVGAVVMPAHAIKSYTFAGYCNDPHLPAPAASEEFQLVSINTLYPPSLQPAVRGLLRIGAQRGGHDGEIQGLIWTIRRTVSGEDMGQALVLSPDQQRVLTQADPNAVQALQTYYTQARGQRLMHDAIQNGVSRMVSAVGQSRAISSISNNQALTQVAALTAQLESTPVPGQVQGQHAAYTLLNNNVAALATTQTGGLATVNVDIANNGDEPTVFMPGTCVAQSTRPAQRLAMQMSTPQQVAYTVVPYTQAPHSYLQLAAFDITRRTSNLFTPIVADRSTSTSDAAFCSSLSAVAGATSAAFVLLCSTVPAGGLDAPVTVPASGLAGAAVASTMYATCMMSNSSEGGGAEPPDPCKAIIQQINSHVDGMKTVYADMLEDEHDLYHKANSVNPGGDLAGYGTWVGHVQRYVGLQVGLQRMISNAEANGCQVPPEAYEWAQKAPPPMPHQG